MRFGVTANRVQQAVESGAMSQEQCLEEIEGLEDKVHQESRVGTQDQDYSAISDFKDDADVIIDSIRCS